MFKKRCDGIYEHSADPILGVASHIMSHRYDAMVNFLLETRCEELDEYIKQTNDEKGIHFSYMEILIAAIVRMYAERPLLNRFLMNGRVYRHDGIYVSFVVKKQLTEDAPETTVKLKFTGEENIFEIKQKVDDIITQNKNLDLKNETDKTAKLLKKVPNGLMKFAIKFLMWMDRHNCMPKAIVKASPFHTSCFLTNMKSISTDYVYHHLYDFGTTGLFVGLGKEKYEPIVNTTTNQIEPGKVLKMGVVIDERICDGFYYAKSIKLIRKYLQNPSLLEENYVIPEKDKVYSPKEIKQKKRAEKRQLKLERKLAKNSD